MRSWGRIERGRRYRLRPGVYAVVLRDGGRPAADSELLLTVQREPGPELQLPGGGIDAGEGAVAALHRELREETGWRVAGVRRIGAYRRWTYMPEYDLWAEKLCHLYLARAVRRLSAPTEAGHVTVWAPLAEAAGLVASDGDRAMLRRLMGR
jgi:8-oxo-dGTP diphosphatase